MTNRLSVMMGLLTMAMAAAQAGEPQPPPPMVDSNGTRYVTVPARIIPAPEERGKRYKAPGTEYKLDPVLWGWTAELPDGSGLAFGGIHQTNEDGIAHTQIRDAGGWKLIIDDLRKANPLQPRFDQTRALRNACKDTLAKARHLYFEGKPAADEGKLIKSDVDPAVDKIVKDLAALVAELKAVKGLGTYEAGQVKFALGHLEAAAGHIKPFGALVTPEQMTAMRKGQIELEIAGEAFDAEPPPRALSKPVYEPKTKLFVFFGGDHFDYQTNDLWVFDPAKRRWFQRHPVSAPEPRLDAILETAGDGKISMRGGAIPAYSHCGPARWIYDLAADTWTADGHTEKTFPSDMRSGYWPPALPEQFMAGPRPDAAANEALLKAVPVNVWTKLKTPISQGNFSRDWATWVYDPDRDMFYVWAGGHASYAGNDVARYHLATDRWEMSEPTSLPLGCIGTNAEYPNGFDFNRRPWCRKHVWNAQGYDTALKKMVMAGANDQRIDPYTYVYDPDKADWVSRHNGANMVHSSHVVQLRNTKHGMLAWYGPVWLLDSKSMEWKGVKYEGNIVNRVVDCSGLVYDPKRDRMLFVSLGDYAKPFDGQISALDLNTLKAGPLNPEGMDPAKSWDMFLREVAYHPGSDMFIWASLLEKGVWSGKTIPETYPAYDAAKNRWVAIKIPGGPNAGVNSGMIYDAKRDLLWAGESGYNPNGVWVLRFDASKADIKPMKDLFPPAAAPAGEKK